VGIWCRVVVLVLVEGFGVEVLVVVVAALCVISYHLLSRSLVRIRPPNM
jgi:hypothetical protein